MVFRRASIITLWLALVATKSASIKIPVAETAGAWADLVPLLDAHKGDSLAAISHLRKYFRQFGYLSATTNASSILFDDDVERAVKLYQQSFGLDATGSLNRATLQRMLQPRCGREDAIDGVSMMLNATHINNNLQVLQRYSYFPGVPRWRWKRNLAYAFDANAATSHWLSEPDARNVFGRAFSYWANIVPISFTEVSLLQEADIIIQFSSFDHGDGRPFDGPLGVLAHAFSPEDGRFHLDSSETWSFDATRSTDPHAVDLESVAVHEIGHLIGLAHSGVEDSIMFPNISPRQVKLQLSQDDIFAAQQLYGFNPAYNSTSTSTDQRLGNEGTNASLASTTTESILLVLLLVFVLVDYI